MKNFSIGWAVLDSRDEKPLAWTCAHYRKDCIKNFRRDYSPAGTIKSWAYFKRHGFEIAKVKIEAI